jgi:hypothetical protein
MNGRTLVRIHPLCPLCGKRIGDRDKVVRVPRRGWVHLACATAAKVRP